MDKIGFRKYLKDSTTLSDETIDNYVAYVATINEKHPVDLSGFAEQIKLVNKFVYTKKDEINNAKSKNKVEIKGNLRTNNAKLKGCLLKYYEFYNLTNHGQATFTGTEIEFEKLLRPEFAKLVQDITRPYKKSIDSQCECCGKIAELQAAHQHKKCFNDSKKVRQDIVYKIIRDNYQSTNGVYTFDIYDFIFKYVKEHMNINKTFFFLCPSCHNRYDDDKNRMSKQDISKIKSTHNSNF